MRHVPGDQGQVSGVDERVRPAGISSWLPTAEAVAQAALPTDLITEHDVWPPHILGRVGGMRSPMITSFESGALRHFWGDGD